MSNDPTLQEQVDGLRRMMQAATLEEQRQLIEACDQLSRLIIAHGDYGIMALCLLGAEQALRSEKENWSGN